jgi:hypothetical protein
MSVDPISLSQDEWDPNPIRQESELNERVYTAALSSGFLETIGRGLIEPELLDPTPLPDPEISRLIVIEGWTRPQIGIGGINGISTLFSEATAHGKYLQLFTGGTRIDWVYNCTHGKICDLAEALLLNYRGTSPNTGALLQAVWEDFHQKNQEHPEAKYLQFCHSKGAIDVRNALKTAPVSIRNRVIVVAIAPAAIVPKELCYQSFNYASEKDIVPKGELLFALLQDLTWLSGTAPQHFGVIELHKQLKILRSHPEASGIDHDFQSATYTRAIAHHVRAYLLSAEPTPFEDGLGADGGVGLIA